MMIERRIKSELRRGRAGRAGSPTRLDVALELLAESGQSKAAAGRYGAYVGKAWKTWLVTVLTNHALSESGAVELMTRERVREWQRANFGQALSSRYLSQYAKGLGYRGEDFTISSTISARCTALYEKYKDVLRARVERNA